MKQFLILLLILTLFSCKKSNTSTTTTKTRYELLINKKWKISGESGYTVNGDYVADAYTSLPDYAKDDYFYFYDNLKFEQNEGPLIRPGSTQQITDHGTWQLTTSDQFITLVSEVPGTTYNPLKILELTDTKLSVEENEPFSGNKVTYSFIVIP